MMRNKFVLLSFVLLLNGCSALPGMQNIDTSTMYVQNPNQSIQAQPVVKPITPQLVLQKSHSRYIYRVQPQDVLNIIVWNHAELNSPVQQMTANPNTAAQSAGAPGYLVNHQGYVYFPLVGDVHVAGKTIDEIRNLMVRRLSYYIRQPQLIVRVADFRSQKVYVMGEVMKAGYLPLNDQPMSITDALNMAGSLDPNSADPKHIYIIRGSIFRPEIYWLNASTPTALLLGEQFQLQNHDIMVVSTAAVTRWNRFLNQLLPTLQTVWYTKAITGK